MIVDEDELQRHRDRRQCEVCLKRGPVEPHHLHSRGFGGGQRLDVSFNLIALDRECHDLVHRAKISRGDLLEIVARREQTTPEAIVDEVHRLRRLDRDGKERR